MAGSDQHDVTRLLQAWSSGDRQALDDLLPLVYTEVRRLARSYLRRERPDHTLQATALVNEAYMPLVDQRDVRWPNRAHFFGRARVAAARGRARVAACLPDLVDARRYQRIKAVLLDALELPSRDRPAFVRNACGDDRDLRAEVESLLLEHEKEDGFLDPLAFG